MLIEIIDKDITGIRLTVNRERITIKFPLGYERKAEMTQLLLDVAKKSISDYTLRGSLAVGGEDRPLYMRNGEGQIIKRFELI